MKILLTTDGGERGGRVIKFLASIFEDGGHEIDLVYVEEVKEEMSKKHYKISKETHEKKGSVALGTGSQNVLNKMSKVAEQEGLKTNWLALKGDPASKIISEAEKYDLVTVGSGGRGIFKKEILGIIANKVVKESPTSVLAVKGQKEKCRKILVCLKNEEKSVKTFRYLANLLGSGKFYLITLYVIEKFPRLQGYMETVEDDIQRVAPDFKITGKKFLDKGVEILEKEGYKSSKKIREGNFNEEVVKEANEGDYDLIVLESTVLDDWFEKYLKTDQAIPLIKDVNESFLLVRN